MRTIHSSRSPLWDRHSARWHAQSQKCGQSKAYRESARYKAGKTIPSNTSEGNQRRHERRRTSNCRPSSRSLGHNHPCGVTVERRATTSRCAVIANGNGQAHGANSLKRIA
jgi:hypothetical protein